MQLSVHSLHSASQKHSPMLPGSNFCVRAIMSGHKTNSCCVCLPATPSICLSVFICVCLSVCLSVCLHLSVCLSVCLPVNLSPCLSLCLYVSVSICISKWKENSNGSAPNHHMHCFRLRPHEADRGPKCVKILAKHNLVSFLCSSTCLSVYEPLIHPTIHMYTCNACTSKLPCYRPVVS